MVGPGWLGLSGRLPGAQLIGPEWATAPGWTNQSPFPGIRHQDPWTVSPYPCAGSDGFQPRSSGPPEVWWHAFPARARPNQPLGFVNWVRSSSLVKTPPGHQPRKLSELRQLSHTSFLCSALWVSLLCLVWFCKSSLHLLWASGASQPLRFMLHHFPQVGRYRNHVFMNPGSHLKC